MAGRPGIFALCGGLLLCLGQGAAALPLDFPGNARLSVEEVTPLGRYALPVAPWSDGFLPTTDQDGELTMQVWRIDAAALTTLQLLVPLRDALAGDGFEILFECETEGCGGFDFRTSTIVLPPPEMFVALSDFRFLAARRGDEAVTLLVSRTADAGYVQVIRIGPPLAQGDVATANAPDLRTQVISEGGASAEAPLPDDFGAQLDSAGRVVLSDLSFPSGSAQLAPGEFASLRQLADYLAANPTRRVALVGHTDSQGGLEANIALSRRRAGSVVERLVADYDVPRQQLAAEGMGYLSPLASNLTAEGREANRRVEVIVTSTE